jgi:hypothetical protein
MRYKHNEYKIVEKYLDRKIEVKVDECWHSGKLANAEIYCLNTKRLSFLDSDVSFDSIYDSVTNEVLIAEKLISDSCNVERVDLSVPREVYIVKEYGRQMIDIKFIVNLGNNTIGMCHPSMDNEPVLCDKNLIIDEIHKEIKSCMMVINDGGILPTPDFLSDEKGNCFTKKLFK